jgi:ubiquinone/menaquinone biosynthesis C-methylase UbiE
MSNGFDERAATWDDDPAKRERARRAAAQVRATVTLDGDTRLLEYGAGTGLLAQELAPHVGPITLVEPSSGMRDVIHTKITAGVLPSGTRALDLDLTRDPVPDDRFDLIVGLMVLHHIPELATVLRAFATLLDPGGTLCVIDLDQEDGSFHGDGFDGHHGFDHDNLAEQLSAAGFEAPRFTPSGAVERDGRSYGLFLASCRLPDDGAPT